MTEKVIRVLLRGVKMAVLATNRHPNHAKDHKKLQIRLERDKLARRHERFSHASKLWVPVPLPVFRAASILLKRLKPATVSLPRSGLADSLRSRTELIVENALLRQQLIIMQRSAKRPMLRKRDKFLLIVLASKLRSWKQALLIIQPDTLLRWHRELFRWLWRRKSKAKGGRPRLSLEAVALVIQLVRENSLWGAERLRGRPGGHRG